MSEYAKKFVETLPDGELPKMPEVDVDDLRYALRVIGQHCHPKTDGFILDCGNGIILRDRYGGFVASGWDHSAQKIMELPAFVPGRVSGLCEKGNDNEHVPEDNA
jgi:hypothetical protein